MFLILKPKYAEDLTLYLSDQKIKTDKINQRKDSATLQVWTNRHLEHNTKNNTSLHTSSTAKKNTDTMIPPGRQLPATSN
jgi:hypothetical protein